jgi:hypothetical protein
MASCSVPRVAKALRGGRARCADALGDGRGWRRASCAGGARSMTWRHSDDVPVTRLGWARDEVGRLAPASRHAEPQPVRRALKLSCEADPAAESELLISSFEAERGGPTSSCEVEVERGDPTSSCEVEVERGDPTSSCEAEAERGCPKWSRETETAAEVGFQTSSCEAEPAAAKRASIPCCEAEDLFGLAAPGREWSARSYRPAQRARGAR